jgi:hypothetical protein
MSKSEIKNGMNLRDAKWIALHLGVMVEDVPGTGEVRFKYPGFKPVKANNRKKSASRAVIALLRDVAELLERSGIQPKAA